MSRGRGVRTVGKPFRLKHFKSIMPPAGVSVEDFATMLMQEISESALPATQKMIAKGILSSAVVKVKKRLETN